jgi:hypothetical protein
MPDITSEVQLARDMKRVHILSGVSKTLEILDQIRIMCRLESAWKFFQEIYIHKRCHVQTVAERSDDLIHCQFQCTQTSDDLDS